MSPGKQDHSRSSAASLTYTLVPAPFPSLECTGMLGALGTLASYDYCFAMIVFLMRIRTFFPRPFFTPPHRLCSVLSIALAFCTHLNYDRGIVIFYMCTFFHRLWIFLYGQECMSDFLSLQCMTSPLVQRRNSIYVFWRQKDRICLVGGIGAHWPQND